MSRPFIAARLVAVGTVAGLLGAAVAVAAPASADVDVTPPASASVAAGELVNVELATPDGFVCDTDWTVTAGGAAGVVEEVSPVFCEDSLGTWTVVVGKAKKGRGTVTFTATAADGKTQSAVLTLTMKPPKAVKPVKPRKPKRPSGHNGGTTLAPPVGVG